MVSRVGRVRGIALVLAGVLITVSCTSEPAATTSSRPTTTSAASMSTSTSMPETTTTTSPDRRIAEVTEIVRRVEFGWFDAIYRKNEEALLSVVARQESLDTALGLMSEKGFFASEPTVAGLAIELREILIDRDDCMAVAFLGDATSFRGPHAVGEVKAVFWPRPSDSAWRRAYQGDEWQAACDDFSRDAQLP